MSKECRRIPCVSWCRLDGVSIRNRFESGISRWLHGQGSGVSSPPCQSAAVKQEIRYGVDTNQHTDTAIDGLTEEIHANLHNQKGTFKQDQLGVHFVLIVSMPRLAEASVQGVSIHTPTWNSLLQRKEKVREKEN